VGALARENAERNGLADRCQGRDVDLVASGARDPPAGWRRTAPPHVLMNPPFQRCRAADMSRPMRNAASRMSARTTTLGAMDCNAPPPLLLPFGKLTLIWLRD
jgi:hypothetical protein